MARARRRRRHRVHRQVPHPRDRRRAPDGRAPSGCSSPRRARASTRRSCSGVNDETYDPEPSPHHLQRVVHDQLRRADGQGAARRVRHRAGLHDHRARLHQRPERPRRAAQGPAPGPGGRGEHHPDHDRRGPGGRPRSSRSSPGGSTASRCACRWSTARWSTWPCCSTARSTADRGQRRVRGGRRRRVRWPGGCATPTDPIVSTDVIGDPASCVFDARLTQAVRAVGEGLRLVRQRVGLHRPPRRPDPAGRRHVTTR